jgi:hypothetical protein
MKKNSINVHPQFQDTSEVQIDSALLDSQIERASNPFSHPQKTQPTPSTGQIPVESHLSLLGFERIHRSSLTQNSLAGEKYYTGLIDRKENLVYVPSP